MPPEGTEPVSLPVRIVQADGGAAPCSPTRVIRDFGVAPADDHTFKAKVKIKQDRGGTTNPDVTTPGTTTPDPGSGGSGGTQVLPRTGGALPALVAVGALLVAGGLLVRHATC